MSDIDPQTRWYIHQRSWHPCVNCHQVDQHWSWPTEEMDSRTHVYRNWPEVTSLVVAELRGKMAGLNDWYTASKGDVASNFVEQFC